MTIKRAVGREDNINLGIWTRGKSTERFIKTFCDVKVWRYMKERKTELTPGNMIISLSPKDFIDTTRHSIRRRRSSSPRIFLSDRGNHRNENKSTTSSMLYRIIRACLGKCTSGRKYRPACLDYYSQIDKDTVIVFEMSCHQLNFIKYSPHIAVFLISTRNTWTITEPSKVFCG